MTRIYGGKYQGNDTLAQTHIFPYFDTLGIKLQEVATKILQAHFDEKRVHGRIDEERGTLAICHTVVKVTSVVEKDKTRNRTSRRMFPLTPEARAIFADAKRKEAENRRLFGADYTENPYVFKWDDGHPYSPDYISQSV